GVSLRFQSTQSNNTLISNIQFSLSTNNLWVREREREIRKLLKARFWICILQARELDFGLLQLFGTIIV
ncbi:hypothetical protein CFP56_007720, partial [Quercus suber]